MINVSPVAQKVFGIRRKPMAAVGLGIRTNF
jgi:hypothetical protein